MAPIVPSLVKAFTVATTLATSSWPISQPQNSGSLKTCSVVKAVPDGDDSAAITAAFQNCSTNGRVLFQRGVTYNAYSPMQFLDLNNVRVEINGNIQLPNNISYIQNKVAQITREGTFGKSWFYFEGKDVSIYGSEDKKWGWFEGHGQQWWDIVLQTNRPRLATFKVKGGLLRNLKHHHMIAWAWELPGSDILVENYYTDNRPTNGTRDSTISFPFNTDGINVAGTNVTVHGYYGYTGDDAVSFISGAKNVTVRKLYAGFSSHGLSIGSLGKNGAQSRVEDVLVEDVTMEGAVYGARFKSWVGGNGYARNVVFRDFKLINVSTPIFVTQNYYDQGIGKPNTTSTNSTLVQDFHFSNFKGYMNPSWTDGTCISNPCWNYVKGGDATQAVILDLYPNTATNLTFKNIDVVPYQKTRADTTVICDPATLRPEDLAKLGFVCKNGPYIAQNGRHGHRSEA
jgi:galacturan 1,4-alpha-galacturonidase